MGELAEELDPLWFSKCYSQEMHLGEGRRRMYPLWFCILFVSDPVVQLTSPNDGVFQNSDHGIMILTFPSNSQTFQSEEPCLGTCFSDFENV